MKTARYGILAIGTILAAGCGRGNSEKADTFPVTGTVMYNGKPVEGATVNFKTEASSHVASGVTDAKGKFQLTTYEANDGAIAGEHVVTVIKDAADNSSTGSADDMMDPLKMANTMNKQTGTNFKGPKLLLPEKYSREDTTPLKKTVTEGGTNNFVLQLKD